MPVSLEQLVQDLSESSVVASADLSALAMKLAPEKQTAEELAKELVRQKKLTKFQAQAAFAGKAKGLVFGEYVVVDKLGQGGMGVVFKAKHRRMDRIVALKVLPAKAMDSPDAVQRFEKEVKAAAKLLHTNIVTAFDAGESNGKHYLVMECVDGDDIAAIIRRDGPLPVEKAISCTIQAARGLQFAHDEGVVHRDIKPGNLLLDKKGTVKILDMGLARFHQPATGNDPTQAKGLTQSGQIMGTCEYMAPEQAEDTRSADHRADVYALGCSLYKMLTGKSVFDGETMIQTLIAHREAEIPSLCDGRDDVPAALDGVFKTMMAKTPEERYQSMSEVILDLETVEASGDLDEVEMMESPPKEGSVQTALTSFFENIKAQDSDATPKVVDPTVQFDPRPVASKKKWLFVGGGVVACLIVVGLSFAFWPKGTSEVDLGGDSEFGGGDEPVADTQPETVDLLKLIDVERDSRSGNNRFEDGVLVQRIAINHTTVIVPYIPPDEYDLVCLVRRVGKPVGYSIGLVGDGHPIPLVIGGVFRHSGLTGLDGKPYHSNETSRKSNHLSDGRQHTIVCRVRRDSVVVQYDGTKIIDWTGDFERFRGEKSAARTLILSGGDNATFYTHKMELTPITGQGRPLYPEESDPD